MVPDKASLIILDIKLSVCMSKNCKDTKHTRNISRMMFFVKNGQEWNLHKTVWCEGGLQLSDIGTKNVREDELNPRLGYTMVRLDNRQKTCTRGVIWYRRVWITMSSERINCIELDSTQCIWNAQWVWIDENNIENYSNCFWEYLKQFQEKHVWIKKLRANYQNLAIQLLLSK